MGERQQPFIPGFIMADEARAAGESFFAKTNGKRGVEGRDFHLVRNKHGRWHFDDGPGPRSDPPPPREGGREP